MSVLTTAAVDRRAIARGLLEASSLVIVALCAAWCDTCNEFRAAFERMALARPGMLFVWLDIEDDSFVCGDIDIENFPTLAIYRGDTLLHFGVSLPHEGTVARLIDEMGVRASGIDDAPKAVLDLAQTFKSYVG